MARKKGLIYIDPELLRWAGKRGDLWMARYFLLEKILMEKGLDFKYVRDMSKEDVYKIIHG